MTKQAAERYALVAAGCVIVGLTAGAFWLSYAHLAEVAGRHGLGNAPQRQWMWPATLDAFIVAGELLMLRAGLRRVPDWWAVALTVAGSVGSIALNVAGVSGTRDNTAVPLLDYVVAAVPPTAALLAFGVLMRQIHQLIAEPSDPAGPDDSGDHDASAAERLFEGEQRARQLHPVAAGTALDLEQPEAVEGDDNVEHEPDGPEADTGQTLSARSVGRPVSGDLDEMLPIAERMEEKRTRETVARAIREAGHTISSQRLTLLMAALKQQLPASPESQTHH
ncbi:DUF2637 domain-containing protein [Streptomyces sp. NBC_01210]|uniref:DUF2637 domain-containing protein n=1 Tax=Streptomyces sp. NBC_01210 TaxID=2903774 RepID=UPI002E0D671D|nr:DUF2637 domain-containing protein [Streptomyces sp. NBC_01210]